MMAIRTSCGTSIADPIKNETSEIRGIDSTVARHKSKNRIVRPVHPTRFPSADFIGWTVRARRVPVPASARLS